ncbi:amidohydrolase family protein [uncultured Eudoraea sp.]|uniref:amidohydrolase family protein n=1 Tax=uncultured Eudoraea sp. TaxID=1035614 RepID=UPI0026159772|nr:amidohydrolase family protein [uncultured Eudoraea sp.]
MVIDSHQHFWKYDPVTYSWIDDSMAVLQKDFLPSDLAPILEKNHVEGCVAVQADQSERETGFLLQLAGENKFIKGVVGWVDLRAEDIHKRLAHFSRDKKLKGIRHIVQEEPDPEFMLRKDFQNGIRHLAQFGLTYDILVYPNQLAAAVLLTRAFPEQKFVLDHIAKPRISEGLDNQWMHHIKELALNPNVSCKISGMVTETSNFKWQQQDFTPFMEVVLDAFGWQRLMYGSDWPVCLLGANYKEVFTIVKDYISKLSDNERAGIMGLNAKEFYAL